MRGIFSWPAPSGTSVTPSISRLEDGNKAQHTEPNQSVRKVSTKKTNWKDLRPHFCLRSGSYVIAALTKKQKTLYTAFKKMSAHCLSLPKSCNVTDSGCCVFINATNLIRPTEFDTYSFTLRDGVDMLVWKWFWKGQKKKKKPVMSTTYTEALSSTIHTLPDWTSYRIITNANPALSWNTELTTHC